jgi:hypothetical protein
MLQDELSTRLLLFENAGQIEEIHGEEEMQLSATAS